MIYDVQGIGRIVAEQDFVDAHFPGRWTLVEDDTATGAQDAGPRIITRLALRNRFTAAEKVALEFAALDDPAAPMPHRQQAAMLRVYMKDADAASFVDLDSPATRAGVQMLEQAGLLAAGRAVEILDATVQLGEAPA